MGPDWEESTKWRQGEFARRSAFAGSHGGPSRFTESVRSCYDAEDLRTAQPILVEEISAFQPFLRHIWEGRLIAFQGRHPCLLHFHGTIAVSSAKPGNLVTLRNDIFGAVHGACDPRAEVSQLGRTGTDGEI